LQQISSPLSHNHGNLNSLSLIYTLVLARELRRRDDEDDDDDDEDDQDNRHAVDKREIIVRACDRRRSHQDHRI